MRHPRPWQAFKRPSASVEKTWDGKMRGACLRLKQYLDFGRISHAGDRAIQNVKKKAWSASATTPAAHSSELEV